MFYQASSLLPIFPYVVMPLFPTADAACFFSTFYVTFLFPTVHAACLCTTVSFQANIPRLPIDAHLAKRGLVLPTPGVSGQQPSTISLLVCPFAALWETSQV